jgi:murein DD-endopeptidase MepM/ murein hydrolase activator NlpD
MNMVGNIAQGTGQAIGSGFDMMPNVGATMQRASSFYGATIRAGGGMSREALQQATMAPLRDAMTSPGSSAMVAAYLTQSNMFASAKFGSTYQETVRSVGGAAKYLGMENTRAAAAIEGMTNRQGASSMLRNFGIFTSDPTTGKEKTQGQIMNEVYSRMTAGRGAASEEQTLASLRRGALGRNLDSMNLSADQRSMYEQFFVEKSRGNNMDLSDPEEMQKLMDKAKAEGNANPDLPGYKLNTSKDSAMQSAEGAYIVGIEAATPALQFLTEAAGNAASALGGIKSGAGLFMGDPVGQAAGSMFGGAATAVGGIGALALAGRYAPGLLSSLGLGGGGPVQDKAGRWRDPKTGKYTAAPSKTAGQSKTVGRGISGKGFGIGLVATMAGNLVGNAISGDSEEGSGQSKTGGFVSGAATGAGIGAVVGSLFGPGPGTAIGAGIGGLIGGGIGAATGGDTGTSNASAQSGAPQAFKLLHPINPPTITAVFGQKLGKGGDVVWKNGHKGVDYAAKLGQTVFAAADGEVIPTDNGGEFGTFVKIKHANGMHTHYAHLSSKLVTKGRIQAGKPIGAAGTTGRSSGVHLHFALSIDASTGTAIDPIPYLSGVASSLGMGVGGDANQNASGASPSSMGDSSGRVADDPSSQDKSALPVTGSTNILEMTSTGYKASGSSSAAAGVESWSAGSMANTGAGQASQGKAGGQGGDGYTGEDKNDYLNEPKTMLSKRNGKGQNKGAGGDTVNNVTINLTVAKGTDDEARRFARMLKQGLEDETLLTNMARN